MLYIAFLLKYPVTDTMSIYVYLKRLSIVVLLAGAGFTLSCEQEERASFIEASNAVEESMMDAYFEDADDLAGAVLLTSDQTEGTSSRVSQQLDVVDTRFCEGVTVSVTMNDESTLAVPQGIILVDFGNGCTDEFSNVRKGRISISFMGRRFRPESVIAITFQNYEINGIILRGTRTLTNVTGSTVETPLFKIQITNGSISWPDGTMATRTLCYDRKWNRNVIASPEDDELIVTTCAATAEAASGMNRRGSDYRVIIDEQLVYKRGCPIAVSGIKRLVEVQTGKQTRIDYGDGECDTAFTITVDGTIHTINAP